MTIEEFFKIHPNTAVALSGGVDSAWLLHEAARCCPRTAAYYVRTAFQQTGELEDAQETARLLGVPLHIVEVDALADPEVAANPKDRCYYCKRHILSAIIEAAKEDGFTVVAEGSNASDDAGDRPGMIALKELGVRSPLRECGIVKSQIRENARRAGLPVWDKPSCACLATRVPTGTTITPEDLQRVDRGESILHSMGFGDLRLRLRGKNGLLQLPQEHHAQARARMEEIQRALAPYFAQVELDPVPRPSRET